MLALCYFLSDVLYLVNLVIQISVLNKILKGSFLRYGISTDMNKVFPKTAICVYTDYTNEHTIKAMCMLPLNYLTDKFVFVLWWWFIFMGLLTCCLILHHMLFILSTKYRNHVLCMKGGKYWKVQDVYRIFQGLTESESIGESVLLQLIIQNLESDTALDLLNLL